MSIDVPVRTTPEASGFKRFRSSLTRRDRTWRLVRVAPDRIEATATDVVGVAEGRIEGRTLRLAYTVRTDPENPLLDVEFDQRLTLEDDGVTVSNDIEICPPSRSVASGPLPL